MHLAKHFAIPRQWSDYALILLARSTYSYPLMPFNANLDKQKSLHLSFKEIQIT